MSRFPVACQTITFGPDQRDRFPEVFRTVREAGYGGVEIGYRHFEHLPPDEFRRMLSDHALHLVASHTGGDLSDLDALQQILDYLNALGTKRLLYSGLSYEDDSQLSRAIEAINRAALVCQSRGVKLCYHNHDWEFKPIDSSGRRIIDDLLAKATPELYLCPDVGWVHKSGTDVRPFLAQVKDRIAAAHFKDFASLEEKVDTVVLGQGIVPLGKIAVWFRENTNGMWIIAEQDTAQGAPKDAVRRNATFLRKWF